MKNKFIFLLAFMFGVANCWSQTTFQKVIKNQSGSQGNTVDQTTDGGYIIGGTVYEGNGLYLIKTDDKGTATWTKIFKSGRISQFCIAHQTYDGGYVVAGIVTDTVPNFLYYCAVIKTDSNGDTIWTKRYGQGYTDVLSIQQTYDGGYILTGRTGSAITFAPLLYLLKIDQSGNIKWENTYTAISHDGVGLSVKQTTDSGYIVTGVDSNHIFLLRTDPGGNVAWTKYYRHTSSERAFGVLQTPDGGFILAGNTIGTAFDTTDAYVIRTDINGNALWSNTYERIGVDYCRDIKPTNDGGYVMCGYNTLDSNIYILKIDSGGAVLWSKSFGGPSIEYGASIQQTTDRGYIITGMSSSFGSAPSGFGYVYLIKTDSTGNSGCNQHNVSVNARLPITTVSNISFSRYTYPDTVSYPVISIRSEGRDSTLCSAVGINELSGSMNISIYPNPIHDKLTINHAEHWIKDVKIYNVLGQNVYTLFLKASGESVTLDLSSLSIGLYMIIISNETQSIPFKFIKE